jgi:hypothetical protein
VGCWRLGQATPDELCGNYQEHDLWLGYQTIASERVRVVEGGNMAEDVLGFSDPWWDLRDGEEAEAQMRKVVTEELRREVGAGHPLADARATVVARCTACDDVALALSDGRLAVVHLTWSGRRERAPWPSTTVFGSVAEAQRGIEWHPE